VLMWSWHLLFLSNCRAATGAPQHEQATVGVKGGHAGPAVPHAAA
jgi:hypothetical protein